MESQLPRTDGHHYESSDLSGNPTSALHSGILFTFELVFALFDLPSVEPQFAFFVCVYIKV